MQINFKGRVERARKFKLRPLSDQFIYQAVWVAKFDGNTVVEYCNVREDGTSTGLTRVKPQDVAWWIKRIKDKTERWVKGELEVISKYTELISSDTAEVYPQVLRRA